jgi:type II secretion system protein G
MNSIKRTAERLAAKRNQDDGFTLIELLVVIVILGVLSAVVVFSVGNVTNRGTQAACRSDAKTLEVAVEAYRAQTNGYPVDEAGLAVLSPGYIRTIPNAAHFDYNGANGAVTPTC